MYDKVAEVIEKIRPYLMQDGGNVELLEVTDDMIVKVKLVGACGTCPFSLHTLKNGIEQMVKKEIPEIKEVVNE
ncbi:MAG: hypothetical protein CVU05_08615 [Bacteroidetes bacterium HGW-Bacteroidetes-21]|nr:MAG: hypothetical protein CVU05_08615 [Bacteroidetes bacterium HGW-Bacteroidetes-21]